MVNDYFKYSSMPNQYLPEYVISSVQSQTSHG